MPMGLKCLGFQSLSNLKRGDVSNPFLLPIGPDRLIADHELTDLEAMDPHPTSCQGSENSLS